LWTSLVNDAANVPRRATPTTRKEDLMRTFTHTCGTAAVIGALALVSTAPAAAALEPNDQASCLALVFQAQAVDEPRTVSDRILFIREFLLQGDQFGQVLKPLAQSRCP
jgi:hypothetical protein